MATITRDIEIAGTFESGRPVLVAEGTYSETVNLHSGVSLYGPPLARDGRIRIVLSWRMVSSGGRLGRFVLIIGLTGTACLSPPAEVTTGNGINDGSSTAASASAATDPSVGSVASASGDLDGTAGSTTTTSQDSTSAGSTSSAGSSDAGSSGAETGEVLCVSVSVSGGQRLTAAPPVPALVVQGSTAATIEGWFRADAGTQGQIIGSRASGLPGWSVRYLMGGTLTLEMQASGGGSVSAVYSTVLAEEMWHHFAFVRSDVFTDPWMLYIDGQEAVASVSGPPQDVGSDYEFELGAFQRFENQRLSGLLGPMALSNTDRYVAPFTPSVILVDDGDTIALWPFDEGAGPTVRDIVGNNDLTMEGATWVETGPACP